MFENSMPTKPSNILEAIPNPNPERNYVVECSTSEFTCLCPRTGQPDFADIEIRYIPDRHIFELKSLKLYLWGYRNEGVFHEAAINQILNDLVAATQPRWMEVKGNFRIRGGIATTITASHGTTPAFV